MQDAGVVFVSGCAAFAAYRLFQPLSWRLFIWVQRRRGNDQAVRWATAKTTDTKE